MQFAYQHRPSTAQLLRLFDDDRTKHCWQLTPDTWRTKFSSAGAFQAWFFQFLTPFYSQIPLFDNPPQVR